MRSSIIQSVLCLVGINSPLQCLGDEGINWKNAKNFHQSNSNFLSKRGEDLDYYTTKMSNERDFRRQLDTILIPRPVGSNNHTLVRQHLARQMRKLEWDVKETSFIDKTPHGKKTFTNVIATLDPNAPRRLVIACHYDSLLSPKGFLGATDSAVPCAMMLNMAKTMKLELENLKNYGNGDLTLQFIFFDGEEAFVRWGPKDSIYGSRHLANTWQNTGYSLGNVDGNYNERIDIFVLLDLIGADDMAFSKLSGSTEVSTGNWFNSLQSIEKALEARGIVKRSVKGSMFTNLYPFAQISDDHKPFQELNVPILHLISSPFPEHWHKMGDNRENLDFKRIANLNKILRVFVAEYLLLEEVEK